jgi:hypothetical protein
MSDLPEGCPGVGLSPLDGQKGTQVKLRATQGNAEAAFQGNCATNPFLAASGAAVPEFQQTFADEGI